MSKDDFAYKSLNKKLIDQDHLWPPVNALETVLFKPDIFGIWIFPLAIDSICLGLWILFLIFVGDEQLDILGRNLFFIIFIWQMLQNEMSQRNCPAKIMRGIALVLWQF